MDSQLPLTREEFKNKIPELMAQSRKSNEQDLFYGTDYDYNAMERYNQKLFTEIIEEYLELFEMIGLNTKSTGLTNESFLEIYQPEKHQKVGEILIWFDPNNSELWPIMKAYKLKNDGTGVTIHNQRQMFEKYKPVDKPRFEKMIQDLIDSLIRTYPPQPKTSL